MRVEAHFITCGRSGHRIAHGVEWEDLRMRFRMELNDRKHEIPKDEWRDLIDYGDTHWNARSYGRYQTILRPAGAERGACLSDKAENFHVAVWWRLRETARYGLPDLYEAKLSVKHGEWADVSELIPAHSEEEAIARFERALISEHANQLASVLGDNANVRAFGAASCPQSLTELLRVPAPTSTELANAITEIREAAGVLGAVLQKWEGSDALLYLKEWARTANGKLLNWRRESGDMYRFAAILVDIHDQFEYAEKRSGRRIAGGRQNVLSRVLAELWHRCGLGEPKFSRQSRFIRACSVVLPWHGVHKADVAQFMRAELDKQRVRGVLIG